MIYINKHKVGPTKEKSHPSSIFPSHAPLLSHEHLALFNPQLLLPFPSFTTLSKTHKQNQSLLQSSNNSITKKQTNSLHFFTKMFSLSDSNMFSSSRRCVWVNGPVIIGAGPSGLAVAGGLKDQGVPFVILERADCIASLWQKRTYDRLKLHLPKQFCQLPHFPFPDHYPDYPSKRQFIEYLESYAARFDINPHFNECVQSAKYDHACRLWRVRTVCGDGSEVEYLCQWLVVATGENAETVVPEIDGLKDFAGEVIHASDYKSGENYRGKKVLVVGCGNSGMEVSLDLCNHQAKPAMVVRSSVGTIIIISHHLINSSSSLIGSE